MKYITQDWTSTKDGYLFFVQRLQEMLFHYSDDIVKAPVHNTQTLLRILIFAGYVPVIMDVGRIAARMLRQWTRKS